MCRLLVVDSTFTCIQQVIMYMCMYMSLVVHLARLQGVTGSESHARQLGFENHWLLWMYAFALLSH